MRVGIFEKEFVRERLKGVELLIIAAGDDEMLLRDVKKTIDMQSMIVIVGPINFKGTLLRFKIL